MSANRDYLEHVSVERSFSRDANSIEWRDERGAVEGRRASAGYQTSERSENVCRRDVKNRLGHPRSCAGVGCALVAAPSASSEITDAPPPRPRALRGGKPPPAHRGRTFKAQLGSLYLSLTLSTRVLAENRRRGGGDRVSTSREREGTHRP